MGCIFLFVCFFVFPITCKISHMQHGVLDYSGLQQKCFVPWASGNSHRWMILKRFSSPPQNMAKLSLNYGIFLFLMYLYFDFRPSSKYFPFRNLRDFDLISLLASIPHVLFSTQWRKHKSKNIYVFCLFVFYFSLLYVNFCCTISTCMRHCYLVTSFSSRI